MYKIICQVLLAILSKRNAAQGMGGGVGVRLMLGLKRLKLDRGRF